MQLKQYIENKGTYLDEIEGAALEQLTQEQWEAALKAIAYLQNEELEELDLEFLSVSFDHTHETLENFENAWNNHWSESGSKEEISFNEIPALIFRRFQTVKGEQRKNAIILDCGSFRLCVEEWC